MGNGRAHRSASLSAFELNVNSRATEDAQDAPWEGCALWAAAPDGSRKGGLLTRGCICQEVGALSVVWGPRWTHLWCGDCGLASPGSTCPGRDSRHLQSGPLPCARPRTREARRVVPGVQSPHCACDVRRTLQKGKPLGTRVGPRRQEQFLALDADPTPLPASQSWGAMGPGVLGGQFRRVKAYQLPTFLGLILGQWNLLLCKSQFTETSLTFVPQLWCPGVTTGRDPHLETPISCRTALSSEGSS